MFKRKYLTTNQEEVTLDDAAENVTVVVVDALAVVVDVVELQSIFENIFYHHFKRSRLELQSMFEKVFYHYFK